MMFFNTFIPYPIPRIGMNLEELFKDMSPGCLVIINLDLANCFP